LSRTGAPRGFQIVFQPLVLAAQPIALAFDASQFLAHANEVATGPHQFVAQRVIGRYDRARSSYASTRHFVEVRNIGSPDHNAVIRYDLAK
jgi:hypothetical protein